MGIKRAEIGNIFVLTEKGIKEADYAKCKVGYPMPGGTHDKSVPEDWLEKGYVKEIMGYPKYKLQIIEKLASIYDQCDVRIQPIPKLNTFKDGIQIMPKGVGNITLPIIYLEDAYEDYRIHGNIAKSVHDIGISYKNALTIAQDINPASLYKTENIVFCLINSEKNRKLLKTIPHRDFCNLSVIYRSIVDQNHQGISSGIINFDIAKALGMDEAELFQKAYQNTRQIFPVTVETMREKLIKESIAAGVEPRIAKRTFRPNPEIPDIYILSNDANFYGASSILYKNELKSIALKAKSDLYILPESTDEVILIPVDKKTNVNELLAMLKEVNGLLTDGYLASSVYRFDKDTSDIRIVANYTEQMPERFNSRDIWPDMDR